MSDYRGRYMVGVDVGGTHGSSVGGRGFRLAASSSGRLQIGKPRASDERLSRVAAETPARETKSSIPSAVDRPRYRYGVGMRERGTNGYGPEGQGKETDRSVEE